MASKNFLVWSLGLGILCSNLLNVQPAEARRAFARGPNGAVGAYGYQGAYGGRAGARAIGYNAGAGIRSGSWAGPNGGSFNTGGAFGYRRGVGGARGSAWNGTTAAGGSGSGWSKGAYNAQTGQGTRASSEQWNTASGKDYGYTGNTSYTKGQGGVSNIDTDNHGDYQVDWAKGQKPVVVKEQ